MFAGSKLMCYTFLGFNSDALNYCHDHETTPPFLQGSQQVPAVFIREENTENYF